MLVDEATLMVGAKSLTKGFETLYDARLETEPYDHHLNFVFVFAGTQKIEELREEVQYEGFVRRFVGPPTARKVTASLQVPQVAHEPAADDFAFAVEKIQALVRAGGFLDSPSVTDAERDELRAELAGLSEEGLLTWHALWAAVCSKYSPVK